MDKEKLSSMDLVRSLPIFILLLSLTLILSTYAFAVPNSLTLQGKLTDLDGAAQSGVYNFSFAIYDNVTSGNRLWVLHDHNITTDANGVYDIILGDINLSFSEQYYLGITVSTDEESSPRVNLTSAPYSFRTNTSDSLKANGSYIVENLSITGNVTIGDGTTTLEISTQLFNLSSIGNLNLNGTVTAFAFVGDGSSLTGIATGSVWNSSTTSVYFNDTTARLGIGTSVPSEVLTVIGNVNISGYLNISGNIVTAGTVIDNGSLNKSIDLSLYNQSIDLSSYLTSTTNDSLWNSTGNDIFLRHITGNVGIGTATPAMKLEVVGNANISQNLTVNNSVLFVDGTAGRVGIGTVSPGGTLDVVGSSASIITRTFTTNPTEPQSAIQIGISGGTNNGVGPSFLFFAPDDGSNKEFLGRLTALWENNADGSEAGAVTLSVRANSGDTNAQTEVLRVTSDSSLIVSGSLNASSINATDFIKVGSNLVQTVESAFNVANNATNDTLRISGNASIALWNVSSADGAGLIKPRDATSLLRIGYVNGSLSNDTLSVIGSSAFYGSLNATFINATQIRQGLNQVQTINAIYDSDNFTTNYDGRGERFTYVNLSSYFGEDNNGTILRLSNMSNIGNVTNNNQLANGAGYLTSLGSTSNFQLANVSNDTLRISGNASIALWNFSTRLGASFVHPRDATLLIRIGYLNESLSNDTLSVIGSSAFYGSLNATFINATEIRQGNNQVQTINAIYDSDNFTTNYDGRGDRFARENITDFFGDGAINGSILRVGNLSNIMESTFNVKNNATNYTTNYPNIDLNTLDDFNAANNATNDTLRISGNASIALWNASGNNIFNREFGGNVGIGTAAPNKKLEVNITAASDGISTNGTIYTPVINTTDAQTNVTITSGSGSVIIRLG